VGKLLNHSLVYGLGTVANQALSFLMLPLYTRYLDPSEYGSLALISAVGSVLGLMSTLGIHSGVIRIFFLYDEPEDRATVVSSALLFSAAVVPLVGALLYLAAPLLAPVVFDFEGGERYFRWATLLYLLMAVNNVSMAALQAYQRPRPFITCSITGLFLSGLTSIYLVAFRGQGLEGVLTGQAVGVAVQLVLTLVVLSSSIRPTFRRQPLREMLAFCVPLIPTNLAAWLLSLADRYFLKAYDTLATVGLYALGWRFGTVLDALFVRSFTQAWFPYLFSILDDPDHPQICARVLEYYTFGGGFIVLGMSLFGGDVIRVMSDSSYWGADGVIYWIALGFLLRGMTYITVAGIQIQRKTHYSAYVYAVGAGANVLLLWWLVPRFSMMGAAVAMVLTYLGITITLYRIAQGLHPIPYRVGKVFGALCLMTALYLPSRALPAETTLATVGAKLALLALFPVLLITLRFLGAEDVARARKVLGGWLPGAAR